MRPPVAPGPAAVSTAPALALLPPELLGAFEAATAALRDGSPGKQLFLRVAALDSSLTTLDLAHDPEIARWPLERQGAALALLQGSPHVTKLNLSGLNLTDAVAPALRAVLEAPISRLEVLSLEQNDFREAGLLAIIDGLRTNTALRELRLEGQKMPTSKRVEEALAAALDSGGATKLCKLGLTLRNDAARRRVDAALFRAAERARSQRQPLLPRSSLGAAEIDRDQPLLPRSSLGAAEIDRDQPSSAELSRAQPHFAPDDAPPAVDEKAAAEDPATAAVPRTAVPRTAGNRPSPLSGRGWRCTTQQRACLRSSLAAQQWTGQPQPMRRMRGRWSAVPSTCMHLTGRMPPHTPSRLPVRCMRVLRAALPRTPGWDPIHIHRSRPSHHHSRRTKSARSRRPSGSG